MTAATIHAPGKLAGARNNYCAAASERIEWETERKQLSPATAFRAAWPVHTAASPRMSFLGEDGKAPITGA